MITINHRYRQILVLQTLISLWSTDDNESIRVLSFFFIMRIVKLDQVRYLEKTLQVKCYQRRKKKFADSGLLPNCEFGLYLALVVVFD